jgi:hypothetical protein
MSFGGLLFPRMIKLIEEIALVPKWLIRVLCGRELRDVGANNASIGFKTHEGLACLFRIVGN